MKIETHLQCNCSDYTIYMKKLSPYSVSKIKELEKDLADLREWSLKERKNRPQEPPFLEPDAETWSKAHTTWKELPEVKAFWKEEKKHWEVLRKKYSAGDGDIFDTSIRAFFWLSKNAVRIDGYLNEGNLVLWLEKIAKVKETDMDIDSE